MSWLSTDHCQPLMTPNVSVIDAVVFVSVSHCCSIVPVQFPCACFERVAPTRLASQSTSSRDRIVAPPYFLLNFPAIFNFVRICSFKLKLRVKITSIRFRFFGTQCEAGSEWLSMCRTQSAGIVNISLHSSHVRGE